MSKETKRQQIETPYVGSKFAETYVRAKTATKEEIITGNKTKPSRIRKIVVGEMRRILNTTR